MADKFVEHESKRCSKRKRGFSHYKKKNPVAKLPKLDEDEMNCTDYYFENGLRKVYPYFYSFSTYVKGRWLGRTIFDVFTKEFKGVHSFQEALDNGLLTVNGKPVAANFVLQNHQFIEHRTHRHENPVVAAPVEIIADTPDLLVINKPSSIPVHPCGRYRFNSMTMLLSKEYGYKNLRTLYRLDRLTSGVLLLPKTTVVSVKMEKQLASKQLLKEYVCRVEGEFPEETIECKEPIGVISIHMGVSFVRPDGKECHTTFTRLSYNGRSSVVKCIPYTGRTHQIRVHLQYLGYPILNDPVYNSTAFGPEKGRGGKLDKSLEELEVILGKWHNTSEWVLGENPDYKQKFCGDGSSAHCDKDVPNPEAPEGVKQSEENDGYISEGFTAEVDNICDLKETEDSKCSESSAMEDGVNAKSSNETEDSKLHDSATMKDELNAEVNKDTDETGFSRHLDNAAVAGEVNSESEHSCKSVIHSTDNECSEKTVVEKSDQCVDSGANDSAADRFKTVENWESYMASKPLDKSRYTLEKTCHICKALYKEPSPKELILFLHAVRYKGPDWEYSTPLPDWAREDWALEDQFALDEKSS